jgi:hypothetical protein
MISRDKARKISSKNMGSDFKKINKAGLKRIFEHVNQVIILDCKIGRFESRLSCDFFKLNYRYKNITVESFLVEKLCIKGFKVDVDGGYIYISW